MRNHAALASTPLCNVSTPSVFAGRTRRGVSNGQLPDVHFGAGHSVRLPVVVDLRFPGRKWADCKLHPGNFLGTPDHGTSSLLARSRHRHTDCSSLASAEPKELSFLPPLIFRNGCSRSRAASADLRGDGPVGGKQARPRDANSRKVSQHRVIGGGRLFWPLPFTI